MTSQDDLVERIRLELQGRDTREMSMFGGISFMVDGRMVASARGDGELLLRIDPAESGALLRRPGARAAVMGPGRSMGPGWITVGSEALEGEGLASWLGRAMAFHASQSRE